MRPSKQQGVCHQTETIKTIAIACGVAILFLSLAACSTQGSGIRPADMLGNTEFLSVYEKCSGPNIYDICGGFAPLAAGTCKIPAARTKFWISTGWSEDSQYALEQAWEGSSWAMSYDGHALDLASFGSSDTKLGGKPTRIWNVCVSNPAPGKHTVRQIVHFEGGSRPGEHVMEYSFTVLPRPGTPTP